jgi:hypothetical protein
MRRVIVNVRMNLERRHSCNPQVGVMGGISEELQGGTRSTCLMFLHAALCSTSYTSIYNVSLCVLSG